MMQLVQNQAVFAGRALHDNSQCMCRQPGFCFQPAAPVEAQKTPLEDWIHPMLKCQFFTPCPRHRDQKKAEATYFCIDCCCRPLCGHCIIQHTGHRLIQIRRYVYCDVVRASDMSPHLDISGVQTYIINQAKVMFLNQRPQSKMSRPGAADACLTCSRTLREGCSYCSLACKVDALVAAGKLRAPPASGSASDSSDCWPSSSGANNTHAPAGAEPQQQADTRSGDSSTSHQMSVPAAQPGSNWDAQQQEDQQQQQRLSAGHAAYLRRHSETSSDGRCSSGYCCRRKQASPRRSPLL